MAKRILVTMRQITRSYEDLQTRHNRAGSHLPMSARARGCRTPRNQDGARRLATIRWDSTHREAIRTGWCVRCCALATLLLTACGSQSPASKLGFTLPALGEDAGLGTPERQSYDAMRSGDCETAQFTIDNRWSEMSSPQNVLVYQSGTELCRGNAKAALPLAEAAFTGGSNAIAPMSLGQGETNAIDRQMYAAVDQSLEQTFGRTLPYQNPTETGWPDDNRTDPRDFVDKPGETTEPTDAETDSPQQTGSSEVGTESDSPGEPAPTNGGEPAPTNGNEQDGEGDQQDGEGGSP